MDAIQLARMGDLKFFKEAPLDVILNARDEQGNNVLSIVALENHVDCCEVICERCPSLSRSQTRRNGYTALAHAVPRGYYEITKLIIRAALIADRDIGEHEVKTLLLSDYNSRHTLMLKAVSTYKTKVVKLLIEADTDNELLRAADSNNDTPLHWAVGKYANLEIAKLLIEADPDFPYVVNNEGKTPLANAIRRAEYDDSPDMLKLILELQPSQCNVRFWTNGRTALHYVVSRGFLASFEDIVKYCLEISLEVVDNEGQNFLHIAVESGRVGMLKYILGMKSIASGIFNGKDNLGRTPLDVAALSQNESIILCLLKNPRVDNMLVQTKYFHWVVETHDFGMMKLVIQAIPDFLKGIESEVLQNSRDEYGDTILFKATQENHLFLCKELYEVCPSLIYHQSKGRCTALHHAAVRGEPEMLKFLIDAGASKAFNEVDEEDIESGGGEKLPQKMLLTMVDEQDDTALHKAVSNHKLEAVKLLIEAGPDFQYTANASGESPLMIAIRKAQTNENHDAAKIKRLLYKIPNQIKARTGDKDWTLLHHAAYKGDISTIEDIIQFCPSSLDLIDNEGRNFLHIAARQDKVQLVKHVLSARQIADSILNDKDNDGNTPLHIAAITGNETLTRCFLFDPRVDKTTVNNEGQHVLQAIKFPYDKRKAGVMDVLTDTLDQSDLKDQRDFDLVVGALIATVSFTAGITVPGGYISDGPNQGTSVLLKKLSFEAFIISNNLALISSLYAVFSHFCARRLREDADIIYQLNLATLCTLASIYCMMVAFITGSFAVLANSNWLAIVVCVNSCTFFIFSCRPMWRIAMQRKRSTAASQHKRFT